MVRKMEEKEFEMEADTTFEEFATIVCEDKRFGRITFDVMIYITFQVCES